MAMEQRLWRKKGLERAAEICDELALEADQRAKAAHGSAWMFSEHCAVRNYLREAAKKIREEV